MTKRDVVIVIESVKHNFCVCDFDGDLGIDLVLIKEERGDWRQYQIIEITIKVIYKDKIKLG